MRLSLHRRLLLGASLVLAAFLGLTGAALDSAFRQSVDNGLRERLQTHIYALLSAADLGPDGTLQMAAELPEARFATPGSGLYARIRQAASDPVWHSRSMLGLQLAFPEPPTIGTPQFASLEHGNRRLLSLSFSVEWEDPHGRVLPFTFSVAEDLGALQTEIAGFRRTLWIWLGGSVLLLMVVQGTILRWSLRPLRQVGKELAAIEAGTREQLGDSYPAELAPLTQGINRFITQEQARLEHYRRGLGDLAHSLKTPLAVLRGTLAQAQGDGPGNSEAEQQIVRMAEIVEYHLQRAATAGRRPLAAPVALAQIISRVTASLAKVHRSKGVECQVVVAANCRYRAEEGDLYELIGNLADNAFKWSRGQVLLQVENRGDRATPGLWICIEDDGPGIPGDALERLALRGQRADSTTPGHGIGLAMVNDIVSAYAGTLDIGSAELGGARVEVRLPG